MATGNPAINAAIAQIIAAQQKPILDAQKRYDTSAKQQTEGITGLSSALAGILGGIAPGIEQTYGDASSRQAAFAKGFSSAAQAAQGERSSGVSDFLQNVVGAPSSQVSQVQGQVNPAGTSDTLYGLKGFIPASTLNQEGAAFTAAAKQLPGIAHSQGLQQIGKVQQAQRDQQSKTSDALAELSGTIPKLRSDLEAQAFDQAYKTHSANLADQKFVLQQQVDAFNQKYKINSYNLSVDKLNLAADKFSRSILTSDRSYKLALASLGIRNAAAQRAALKDEYKLSNGGYSVEKIGVLKGDAAAIAQDTFNGFTDEKTNKKYPPLKFGQALTEMRKGAGNGSVPLSIALGAMEKAGYKIPARYSKLMKGALGQSATPFASSVVGAASQFLGIPYSWGGGTPKGPTKGTGKGATTVGYDCSSFIQAVFAQQGIKLPRTTFAQVRLGTPVTLGQLQPGDVIFTRPGKNGPNHVGLYIGNGQVQESPHTGDVNKIIPLQAYLSDGFVAARRYLNG